MDDISAFMDKTIIPSDKDLVESLGSTYDLWMQIHKYALDRYPSGLCEWNYPEKIWLELSD